MKLLIKILLLCVIIIFTNDRALSESDSPLTSIGVIRFYLDHAGFKGENGKTFQEFYLMLFEDNLVNSPKSTNSKEIKIETSIVDNFGKLISSNQWTTSIGIHKDSSVANYLAIYDQWAELLDPGEYNLSVKLSDPNSENVGSLSSKIIVDKYDHETFSASKIEFVSSYDKVIGSEQFQKGNISIKPNPWRRYGILRPTLLFYYEVYNIQQIGNDTLKFVYNIIDAEGSIIKTVPSKRDKGNNETKAVLQGLDVSNLVSGIYSLNVEIISYDQKLLNISREFEVIQSDYLELTENSNKIVEMTENILPYLVSPVQLNIYNNLSDNAKINYLIEFWEKNNNDNQGRGNNYFLSVMHRYNYVNENYSWGNIEGWATERGRVFIQNGNPEEIQRFYFEDAYKPYEIWKYLTDREFAFVFCDVNLNDKFILLHSTKEGEVFNADWRLQAKR